MVELAEIRVADVENSALITYKDPSNTYRHFVDDGIGEFRDKSHANGSHNFLTDDLQYTIEYPSHDISLPYLEILIYADKYTLSTEKLHTPTSMSAKITVPLHPPKTMSSDTLQDEPTSYAHLNNNKNNWTKSTQPRYKMDTSCQSQTHHGQRQTKTKEP